MFEQPSYQGLFKSRYNLAGRRDWVRLLNDEDRKVFIQVGMAAWQYGRLGGLARAASAVRDNRGRFASQEDGHGISEG